MPLPEAHRRAVVRLALGALALALVLLAVSEADAGLRPLGANAPGSAWAAWALLAARFLVPLAAGLLLVLVATRSLPEEERAGVEVALPMLLAALLAPALLQDTPARRLLSVLPTLLAWGALFALVGSRPRARRAAAWGGGLLALRWAASTPAPVALARLAADASWRSAAETTGALLGALACLVLAASLRAALREGRLAPAGPPARDLGPPTAAPPENV